MVFFHTSFVVLFKRPFVEYSNVVLDDYTYIMYKGRKATRLFISVNATALNQLVYYQGNSILVKFSDERSVYQRSIKYFFISKICLKTNLKLCLLSFVGSELHLFLLVLWKKKIKNPYLVTHQFQLGISRNKEDIIRMTNIFTVPKNLVTCSLLDLSLSQIFRRNHFKIKFLYFLLNS